MNEINYTEFFNEVVAILNHTEEIVIFTKIHERISSRIVYCICDNLNIYFIGFKDSNEYNEVNKNDNITLSTNNIEVEGFTEILGHPLAKENNFFKFFCEEDEDHWEYYKEFSKYKHAILIKVNPTMITIDKGRGTHKYLNIKEKKAYQKDCM